MTDSTVPPPRSGRLFPRLIQPLQLEKAWEEVLSHYPRASIPAELQQFDQHRRRNLERIARQLQSGNFVPEPAALLYIPKPGKPGDYRPITLIKLEDRIVLTLLNRLLTPLFEPRFLQHSYAYRKGRSALGAVDRVEACLQHGLEFVALADIDEFFPSIDRGLLLEAVRQVVWEQPILELLETYLHMGAIRRLEWIQSDRGIAQGSPLSPLLSNVYLLEFDRFLESLPTEWVRYADNFILLGQDPELVRVALDEAERFLATRCKLQLNPDSRLLSCWADGFEFLGWQFVRGRRTMSPSRLEQKKLALREHFQRHREDLEGLVASLRETVLGWRQYYGSVPHTQPQFQLLEQHMFSLFQDWMSRYRQHGPGKRRSAMELKAVLLDLELPATVEPGRKLKWIELLLAQSRPPKSSLPRPVRRAIARSRREHQKKKQALQQVLITRPGTSLGRRGERLLVRREGKPLAELPLAMIRSITVTTTAVSFSGELVREAATRDIPFYLLGPDGKPLARIGAPEAPSYNLSLAQLRLATSAAGLELARLFVLGKIANQMNLLRYYAKYPARRSSPSFPGDCAAALEQMQMLIHGLRRRRFGAELEPERERLFAVEGQAAASYWHAVRSLLGESAEFPGRVRRGARDLVNSLLNYGYGILYTRLLGVLVRSGLNISVGFLHKPAPGKPALLFDFIEEFRVAAVDRVVFSLLNWRKPYEVGEEGLTEDTRRDLARRILNRLGTPIRYHGEAIPLEQVMECQAQRLVRHLLGREPYQPFVLPW